MHYMTGPLMRQFSRFYFFVLIVALSLVSCARKPDQALVGKWQDQSGTEVIEFMKDGSFRGNLIWDLQKTPLDISGTYTGRGELIDLNVEKPDSLTPMTWKIKLSGSDQLTIVYDQGGKLKLDGSSATFHRIK